MMKTARKRPGAGMAPKTVKNKKLHIQNTKMKM